MLRAGFFQNVAPTVVREVAGPGTWQDFQYGGACCRRETCLLGLPHDEASHKMDVSLGLFSNFLKAVKVEESSSDLMWSILLVLLDV